MRSPGTKPPPGREHINTTHPRLTHIDQAPPVLDNYVHQMWSNIMASARMTVGTLLGTVNEVATSVSSIFDTATKSINMLNRYVSEAAEKQALRSIVDTHGFKERLVEEKTMETVTRKLEIKSFCSQSQHHADLYQATYNEFLSLLENT